MIKFLNFDPQQRTCPSTIRVSPRNETADSHARSLPYSYLSGVRNRVISLSISTNHFSENNSYCQRRAFVPNLVSPVKYGAGWSRMDLCRILRTNASQWIIALPVISITLFFLTSGFHYKCNLPPSSSHFPLLLRFDPCRIINFHFAHFFPFHPFVYPPFNYPAQRDLSSPLDFRSFLRKKKKETFLLCTFNSQMLRNQPGGKMHSFVRINGICVSVARTVLMHSCFNYTYTEQLSSNES